MSKATPEQTKKARKAAFAAAAVVVAFAAAFIALVLSLDTLATQIQEEEISLDEQLPENPFYVLLIGSDTRKGTALYNGKPTEHAQVDQHSDVMTLVRVDPKKYVISLLTIPRDTVLGEGGEKINSALLDNDPEQVVEAVYELTGLRADYYMLTTFGLFVDLVDAIGGITVDVVYDVEVTDPTTGGTIKLEAGENQQLDGSQTLALARARAEYQVDQDALRQSNVRAIEQAIFKRMLEGAISPVEALIILLENDLRTNMDIPTLGLTVYDFMDHADDVVIFAGTGPYKGDIRAEDEQWVIDNDQETWKEIMTEFKHGHDFATIVEPPTFPTVEPEQEPEQEPEPSSGDAAPGDPVQEGSSGSFESHGSDTSSK